MVNASESVATACARPFFAPRRASDLGPRVVAVVHVTILGGEALRFYRTCT